jgi:hypothetical protein
MLFAQQLADQVFADLGLGLDHKKSRYVRRATGNSLNLYDTVTWRDDANHFVNWLLLLSGIGILIARPVRPRWALVLLVTGAGAILAIGWELGEWLTFIRQGTELAGAYQDTLGDLSLGTLGSLVAGFVVLAWSRTYEGDALVQAPVRSSSDDEAVRVPRGLTP